MTPLQHILQELACVDDRADAEAVLARYHDELNKLPPRQRETAREKIQTAIEERFS